MWGKRLEMLNKILVAALVLVGPGTQSYASSDAAWSQLFAKVNGTCIGLSGMNTPEASEPIVFDDATGKVAVLLRGLLGKGQARAPVVNLMCLYDKKTGKASIAEYKWPMK
jgi:hypothetical protein